MKTLTILLLTAILFSCKKERNLIKEDPEKQFKLYHYKKMIQIASMAEVKSGMFMQKYLNTKDSAMLDSAKKYVIIYSFTVVTPKPWKENLK